MDLQKMNEDSSTSPFLEEYEKSPVIIPNNNGAELKHALDDALRKLLTADLGFAENHKHTDVKLALGYGACAFAAAGSAYSYFNPFPNCKTVLAICVIAYFFLNGLMMSYSHYVEQDIIFVGTKADRLGLEPSQTITVRTRNKKFSPTYTITSDMLASQNPSGKRGKRKIARSGRLEREFGSWFDVDGRFAASVFRRDVLMAVGADGSKKE